MSILAKKISKKDTAFGRFYEIDGRELPSVTHILSAINKPALVQWAANTERAFVMDVAADLQDDLYKLDRQMGRAAYLTTLQARLGKAKAHQKELAKASEIGTQVHARIEWELRTALKQDAGKRPKLSDPAQWALMAWEDWAKEVRLEPIYIEQVVYSLHYGYAGTMDLYAKVEGRPTVIDFKTGKAIYAESHLQNAAYQIALYEMGHAPVTGGLIVRLPKVDTDPEFEVQAVAPGDDLLPTLLAVRAVWEWWYAQDEAWRKRQKAAK